MRGVQHSRVKIFGSQISERWVSNAWPARSRNLNPMDFHLLDHLKSTAYVMAVNEEYELQQTTEDEQRLIRNRHGNCEYTGQGVMRFAARCVETQGTHYTF